MISCVMQVVFVKTERCATGAADHHRGFCRRSTEGNSRSHQSLDLLLAAPRFLLSLFYSNNYAVAERHIMTKLVMMGSRRDYNPTRLISTTQSGAHVRSVLISLSLSLLQFWREKKGIRWHVNLACSTVGAKKMRLSVKLLRNDLTGESVKLKLKLEKNSQRSTEKKETWPLSEN